MVSWGTPSNEEPPSRQDQLNTSLINEERHGIQPPFFYQFRAPFDINMQLYIFLSRFKLNHKV